MRDEDGGVYSLAGLEPIASRPGSEGRDLIGSQHGFHSLFVSERVMAPGSFIPLHTHPIEEAWVVLEGELTFQVGEDIVTAAAQSVVRVAPEMPHAVRNRAGVGARALSAAPWDRAGFFREATTYLEGRPRTD